MSKNKMQQEHFEHGKRLSIFIMQGELWYFVDFQWDSSASYEYAKQ